MEKQLILNAERFTPISIIILTKILLACSNNYIIIYIIMYYNATEV